jgi:hypothetical protein
MHGNLRRIHDYLICIIPLLERFVESSIYRFGTFVVIFILYSNNPFGVWESGF